MKKIIAALLLIVMIIPAAFADASAMVPDAGNEFGFALKPFTPGSPRLDAMGGAGMGIEKRFDSFLVNPANLASNNFTMVLPNVGVTYYNVAAQTKAGVFNDMLDMVQNGATNQEAVSVLSKVLGTIENGPGALVKANTDIALNIKNVGLAFNLQETVYTNGKSIDTKLVSETAAQALLGVGFRIPIIGDSLSIDLGASVGFAYRAYSDKVSGSDLIANVDNIQAYAQNIPFMAGYAVPINAGINLNIPLGFEFNVVARNMNGNYKMSYTDNYEKLADFAVFQDPKPVTVKTPWTIDAGFAWELTDIPLFNMSIAIDYTDIAGLIRMATDDDETNDAFIKSTALSNLALGAEMRLLDTISLRYGLSQGYQSVGVGLDILFVQVNASYFWREWGEQLGDKPLDALSVSIAIGTR